MKKCNQLIFLLSVLMFFSSSLLAQKKAKAEDEHKKYNEIFVFFGGTSYIDHDGDYFSVGVDYGRILTDHFGVGLWVEVIYAEHTEYTGGLPFYFFQNHFWFRIAPGFEILQEAKDPHHPHETESVTEFLLRAGFGYAFHYGEIVIAPSLDADFVRTTVALVYGVNVGYAF